MSSSTFPNQVKSSLINECHLLTRCIQHYALHCSTDGHFAQLIFATDLIRAHRSTSKSSAAITELLINHFVSFEEQLGTHVKTLAFFLRDLLIDQSLAGMNVNERRFYLLNIDQKVRSLEYVPMDGNMISIGKEEMNIEGLIDHILDTLPKRIFDREGSYHELLSCLVKHNLDRIDDYLVYNEQLSFVTTGSSIKQSRLIDGIHLPVHNASKLLSSLTSNSNLSIVFLNFEQSTEFDKSSSFTIIDHQQEFFSYETSIYRQFITNYLMNVNLIISLPCLNELFLFELHQANISVIDALDEQTFEFLLKVYRCLPCNRLFISPDESAEKVSSILLDRHVKVNQQAYIYLSSNGESGARDETVQQVSVAGSHQTLLSCVPTSTLILTTQRILMNIVRLVKFLLEQLNKASSLPVAKENEYLRFIQEHVPELRHVLDCRRIHLDKIQSNQLFPICIFQEYLLNGISFLTYINKIDGVYSTTRKIVVEKC